MFSLYSRNCEYAIRALAEISNDKAERKYLAREICRKADIPEPYARKTFQLLVRNGFLKAVPGPGGGYTLARDPRKTTVLDVIETVEGPGFFSKCVLGLSACGERKPCALHSVWVDFKKQLMGALGALTLSELTGSGPRRKKL
jgi:Rrf2 family protein